MKRDMVLQNFREPGTEPTLTRQAPGKAPIDYEFSTEFRALGKDHSYHFGFDFNSDQRLLVIAGKESSLEDALQNGTVLSLGSQSSMDQGYNRTLLIERSMIGGLPLDDAIRLTEAITDYDALEAQLGDAAPAPANTSTPAQKPAFEMQLRKG